MRSLFSSTQIFLIVCILSCGCTSSTTEKYAENVSPVTYRLHEKARLEKSVGMLRRLLVLPIQLEVSPEEPTEFFNMQIGGPEKLGSIIQMDAVHSLRRERGYDVISVERDSDAVYAPFNNDDFLHFADVLADFANKDEQGAVTHDDATTIVKQLGEQLDIDGIVVIQGSAIFGNALDLVALYATFMISAPITLLRVGVSLRADIFEVATGRKVWGSKLSTGAFSGYTEYGVVLFDSIEPAIPEVMTLPTESELD